MKINLLSKFVVIPTVVFLFTIIVIQTIMIFSNDISLEPVLATHNNKKSKQYFFNHSEGVHLISYADRQDIFYKNQHALMQSAINKGIDHIYTFRRNHLNKHFLEENSYILNQSKGAGYWLWKPYLILHMLESLPENAILIYSDSKFVFKRPILPIINTLLHKDKDIMLVEYDSSTNDLFLEMYAQRYTLDLMNCSSAECRKAPLLWAAFSVYKNTPKSRAFVKKWLDACLDPKKIMETNSILPEYSSFKAHRHDEALLSILSHYNSDSIYFLPVKTFIDNYVSSHSRYPDGHFGLQRELISVASHTNQYKKLGKLEKIYNAPLFIYIKDILFNKSNFLPWRDKYYAAAE